MLLRTQGEVENQDPPISFRWSDAETRGLRMKPGIKRIAL